MKNSKDKSRKRIVAVWILFICMLALTVAAVLCCFRLVKDMLERDYVGSVRIGDAESFLRALENSNEIRQYREYVFTDDVTISTTDINGTGYYFYGRLYGGGYTLTIAPGEGALTSPIFKVIDEGAEVERLNIEVAANIGQLGLSSGMAVLAETNNGKIANCTLNASCVVIDAECRESAALVVINKGDIECVCLSVGEFISDVANYDDWVTSFGGIAAVNFGTINNILADVNFGMGAGRLPVFENGYNNLKVGYIFGSAGSDASADNLYIFNSERETYSRACDVKYLRKIANGDQSPISMHSYSEIYSNSTLCNELLENWDSMSVWDFTLTVTGGNFPTLRTEGV